MTSPEAPDNGQATSMLESAEVEAGLAELIEALGTRRAVVLGKASRDLSLPIPWERSPPLSSGRLPFENRSIDLLVIDEPRALVSPIELAALLKEGWRTTAGACVLVSSQRSPVEDAQFELVARESISMSMTTVRVEGASMLVARRLDDSAGMQRAQAQLEQRLADTQALAARLRAQLNKAEAERDAAQRRLGDLSQSYPSLFSVNSLARKLVMAPVQKVSNRVTRLRQQLHDRGFSWPDSFVDEARPPPPEAELTFGGVARRARPSEPEDFLTQRPRTVALCHPDWRGIRAATLDQCEHVIEVPGFATRSHALRLAGFLRDCSVESVVMNGFPPGTELFAAALKEVAPTTQFFIVWHGTPAVFDEGAVLQTMLELHEKGLVTKLGFVKHGLAEYFRHRGARAEWVMNRYSGPSLPPAPSVDGKVKIGVFAPYLSHKNVETQLIAALLVPGSEVHTIEPARAAYLQAESHRIHAHGMMPRPEFLEMLRTMQAATYVSLVECYPMTVLESIFSGVICVTSNTSVIFDDSPVLREALVVAHHDSPAAIAQKLAAAIERRESLIPLAQAHLVELNLRAEKRWVEFLES